MSRFGEQRAKVVHVLSSQSLGTGTNNSSAVDVTGFDEAFVIVNAGAHSTGTDDIKIQDSADGASGWADVTNAAFTQITSANHNGSFVGFLDVKKTKRFIRVVTTVAVASVLIAETIILYRPDASARVSGHSFAT